MKKIIPHLFLLAVLMVFTACGREDAQGHLPGGDHRAEHA